jgi:two pore calcium channel protein
MSLEPYSEGLSNDVKLALKALSQIKEQENLSFLQASLLERKAFKSHRRLRDEQSLRKKRLFRRLWLVRDLAVCLYMTIAFFEVPSWCKVTLFTFDCRTRGHQVPWSNIPKLHNTGSRCIELSCLLIILALHTLRRSFTINSSTSSLRNVSMWVLSLAAVGDILHSLVAGQQLLYAQYLRPLIFMIVIRAVRESMMSIARTVKAAFGIFVLITLHIIFFALVGMILFAGSAEGVAYFDSVQISLWNMVIMLTTTNYPDMMMPAYHNNRLYAFYFVTFYLIGLFFLYKLVLASFYNNYRLLIERQAKKFAKEQQSYVYPTFLKLDPRDEGFITKDRFSELVKLLRTWDLMRSLNEL